jgi:undecaprenyl-diphosphatase
MNILDTIRFYDFSAYHYIYNLGVNSSSWQYFFYFFARFGIVFFFLSFIYLIFRNKIRAFLCVLFAMGFAGVIDFLVFVFWQRPHPYISHPDVVKINFNNLSVASSSFPSSHTYVAFAIATSVFLYGHKKLGTLLFVLAFFVAIGRIGVGLHYPSDIMGGVILGILSGVVVYSLVRKWEKKSTN